MLREASFGEDGNWPSGRELHSATSMNDRGGFVVIGGKGANGQVFDDVWEISVGSTVTQTILSDREEVLIDGAFTKGALTFDADEDRCIESIDVELSLQHPCFEQIGKIELAGPKGHRVTLFASDSVFHSDEKRCEFGSATITFTDHAAKKLGDGYFLEGSIRPMEALSLHFSGSKANGQWKIAILDTTTDDSLGVLNTDHKTLPQESCRAEGVRRVPRHSRLLCSSIFSRCSYRPEQRIRRRGEIYHCSLRCLEVGCCSSPLAKDLHWVLCTNSRRTSVHQRQRHVLLQCLGRVLGSSGYWQRHFRKPTGPRFSGLLLSGR